MIRLNLAVARSCFVQCRGCYNHFSDESELVSADVVRAFLDYCNRQSRVAGVTLCGGDPLSRSDIISLVSGITELGIPVKLDTVGTSFLGPSKLRFFGSGSVPKTDPAELLPLLNWIGIPLDGWSQESVTRFRKGRPRLFEETLEVLHIVSRFDTPVGVNTVVHQGNVDDLDKVGAVLASFRVAEWQLFEYRPSGPLSFRNREQFMLPAGRFDKVATAFSGRRSDELGPALVTAKSAYEVLPSRLVVDSAGLAWSHLKWMEPPASDPGPRRVVVGNIRLPSDYERILAAAEACMEGRAQSEGSMATTPWMSTGVT
jgi:pyruvate-formate lyase-activating enzyme